MRLWHKGLISCLPREQLVEQWRELSTIAGAPFSLKYKWHRLPMSYMQYNFG